MSIMTIRIENDVEQSLKIATLSMQRTKNWIINEALREFLQNRQLAKERWQDTMKGLEDIRMGRIVDGDKVFAWLDSWGKPDESDPPIQ